MKQFAETQNGKLNNKHGFLRRLSAFLLAMLTVASFAVVSYAATPDSRTSQTFLSGKYGANFKTLPLSGNLREDTLALALSQLGYREGNSNSDFHGENSYGSGNFTEFCYHYGQVPNNDGVLGYCYDWCAAFVSWCARMAGVPTTMLCSEVSCARMITWLRERNLYHLKAGYTPKPGDIIFFKDEGATRESTHVGYVLYNDGTYVYTIEGNNSNQVKRSSYLLGDSYIVGYGVIAYSGSESTVDYSQKSHDAGWYISLTGMTIRSGESTDSETVGYIPSNTVFGVSLVRGDRAYINYNGIVGWVTVRSDYALQISHAEPPEAVKYTVRFTKPDGSLISVMYLCAGDTFEFPTAPEIEGYEFYSWSKPASAVSASTEYTALYREILQVTEPPTEALTEAPTEPITEPVTDPVTEQVTEPITDPGTENVTEPVTDPFTDPVTGTQTETDTGTEPGNKWQEPNDIPVKIISAIAGCMFIAAVILGFIFIFKKE